MIRIFTPADLPQGSPGWHALRRRRIGASELPRVAGYAPGAIDVWRAKVGAEGSRGKPPLFLRVGLALEPLLWELAAEELGATVQGPTLAEEAGVLSASLDQVLPGDRAAPTLEGKTRTIGSPDYDLWTDTTIPLSVDAQATSQALLWEQATDHRAEAFHVVALIASQWGYTFRSYRVELDAERRDRHAEDAEHARRWWGHYVAGGAMPPDATAADVGSRVQLDVLRLREATEEEAELVQRLAAAEAERRDAAARAAEAVAARDAVRDDLARRLGPDHLIPGVFWRRHGGNLYLAPERIEP